jgi:hypothetical protein
MKAITITGTLLHIFLNAGRYKDLGPFGKERRTIVYHHTAIRASQ